VFEPKTAVGKRKSLMSPAIFWL